MNFSELLFGFFALKIYGIGATIAFLVSALHFYRQLESKASARDFFVHHFWRWVLAGVIAGRVFVLLLYPDLFTKYGALAPLVFWDQEIHPLATPLGFFAFAAWDLKRHNLNGFQWFFDALESILIGLMILDVFGFLTGSIYGIKTNLPWGIRYETFGVDILSPVHPVTLYGLGFHFLLFRWIVRHKRRYSNRPKALCGLVALWLVGGDFLLQFLRADQTFTLHDIRLQQILDGVLLLFLWFWYRQHKS